MLITSNYNIMCNEKKTVIHIPKLRVRQYLLLFDISCYLKISLICSKFLMLKRTSLWQKNIKMLKILKNKFKKRRVKPKCSIDKKTKILPMLYQFHHQNLNVGLSAIISRKKFAIVNLFLIT